MYEVIDIFVIRIMQTKIRSGYHGNLRAEDTLSRNVTVPLPLAMHTKFIPLLNVKLDDILLYSSLLAETCTPACYLKQH
jgi:hypothetical protein